MTLKTRRPTGPRRVGVPGGETARLPTGTGRLETVALGSFELDDGTTLADLTVAYRHDGPAPGTAPRCWSSMP